MKSRCYNKNNPDYQYYGGKGITICDEWLKSRQAFENWAYSHGYKDELTIDRIDGNKGYSPENCHFITLEEQQRNKSNNYNITHGGKTQTLSEWAREYGIQRETLRSRIEKLGYSFEEAVRKEYKSQKNSRSIKYQGNEYSASGFARIVGVTYQCICKWIDKGYTPEQIIDKFCYRKGGKQ